MLKSINTILAEANAQPKHKIWVEYFQKSDTVSKDVYKQFPQLYQFSKLVKFKAIDSSSLKKMLSSISPNNPLESHLISMLALDEPIPHELYNLINSLLLIPDSKSKDKKFNSFFDCVFRYFICYAHQVPTFVHNGLFNFSEYSAFINFLVQFNDAKRSTAIITIFDSIFAYFQSCWHYIFSNPVQKAQQQQCLDFLCYLRPYTELLINEYQNFSSFDFSLHCLSDTTSLLTTDTFTTEILDSFMSILSPFIQFILNIDQDRLINLCLLTSMIIGKIPSYQKVDINTLYLFGCKSLEIYGKASKFITDDLARKQMANINTYALWISQTFPDDQKPKTSESLPNQQIETTLGSIGKTEYLKTAIFIPLKSALVSNFHLEQTAKLIASSCQSESNQTVLISSLLDSLQQNEKTMDVNTYKTFSALVLIILTECKYQALFNALMNKGWAIFFSKALFPLQIDYEIDENLRNGSLYILLQTFFAVQKSQRPILDAIADFMNNHDPNCIYIFVPFFNSLLTVNSEIPIAHYLVGSSLMDRLLSQSIHDLSFFDLVRNLIYSEPIPYFESASIVKFCLKMIETDQYAESILMCVKNAFDVCFHNKNIENNAALVSLICILSSKEKMSQLYSRKPDIVSSLITILSEAMKKFDKQLVNTLIELSTFEAFTQIYVQNNDTQLFTFIINHFIDVCNDNYYIMKYFRSNQCKVYSILIDYCNKQESVDDEEQNLFHFLLLDHSDKNLNEKPAQIKNYFVLPLIFAWSQKCTNDLKYHQILYDLASKRSSNVIQMVKADILPLLLSDIEKHGLNYRTQHLFDLFVMICKQSIPTPVFYHILTSIADPAFEYPCQFLQLLIDLLDNHSTSKVSSFFHFEDEHDGIFGPIQANIGCHFGISLSVRFDEFSDSSHFSLLKLVSSNDSIEFYFEKLFLHFKTSGSINFSGQFFIPFDTKYNWHSLFLEISSESIHLYVDNVFDPITISSPFTMHHQSFSFTIGRGFQGDISEILVSNTNFQPPLRYSQSIIMYSPSNTNDMNEINDVYQSQKAEYRGDVLLFLTSIADNVQTDRAISEVLLLLKRLQCCDHCKSEEGPQRCLVCGSLNFERGNNFMNRILTLFGKMAIYAENIIEKHKFMLILADYIQHIQKFYITKDLLDRLLEIFKSLTNYNLLAEMTEFIWFYPDFYSILPNDLKLELFEKVLPIAYAYHYEPFNEYSSIDYLFYVALFQFTDESTKELSLAFCRLLFTIIPNRNDIASCSILLTIPMFHQYGFSVVSALKCIEQLLINDNINIRKVLENSCRYMPLIYLMQFPEVDLQISAVRIMSIISELFPDKPITSSIYKGIACYVPSKGNAEKLLEAVFLLLIPIVTIINTTEEKQVFKFIEFFPLFVFVSSFCEKEKSIIFYNSFLSTLLSRTEALKLTKLENWSFWLYTYVSQFYNVDDSNEFDQFIMPFKLILVSVASLNESAFGDCLHLIYFACLERTDKATLIIHSILSDLYNDALKDHTIISDSGINIFTETFILLFYSIQVQEISKNEPPSYVSTFPFLDRFYWTPSIYIFKSNFKLRCSDDGTKWKDMKVSEKIIDLIDILLSANSDYMLQITIGDAEIPLIQCITYIICNLMRFKSAKIGYYATKLSMILCNYDAEEQHICASMILRTYSEIGDQDLITPEPFLEMMTSFIDIEDSEAFQLFQFEQKLLDKATILTQIYNEKETIFLSKTANSLKNLLGVNSLPTTVEPTIDSFLDVTFSSSVTLLRNIYSDLKKNDDLSQNDLITSRTRYKTQLVQSFENEIKALRNDNETMHFKAINRISQSGRRTLLAINYNFNDHKAASLMRDLGASAVNLADYENGERIKTNRNKTERILQEEVLFKTNATLMTPHRNYYGVLHFSNSLLVFTGNSEQKVKYIEIECSSIIFVMQHHNVRTDKAAEVYTNKHRSYLFIFENNQRQAFFKEIDKVASQYFRTEKDQRRNSNGIPVFVSSPSKDMIFTKTTIASENSSQIPNQEREEKYDFFNSLRKAYGHIYQDNSKKKLSDIVVKSELIEKWQAREITNYEYLYYLNLLAGRSFNDLSKYPVFPMMTVDDSPQIDLLNHSLYRDLSKPVGALGKERLAQLLRNYNEITEPTEKCLYRTHFSSSMLVCSYMIRIEPFTSLHIEYQGQKFDQASRLFSSWKVSLEDTGDFREWIPEFFTFPYFLVNSNHFDFGGNVDDVILPKWASSPDSFIQTNRRMLESDFASASLHKWIDLLFGVNRNSIEANNVFHPNTYLENTPEYPEYEMLMNSHVQNIGCYPLQVFQSPSPPRGSYSTLPPLQFSINIRGKIIRIRKQIIASDKMALTNIETNQSCTVNAKSFGDIFEVSRSLKLVVFGQKNEKSISIFDMIKGELTTIRLNFALLKCATIIAGRYLALGLSDCSVRVYSLPYLQEIKTSSYHLDHIVSLAGNYEVGLIVSCDNQNKLIFEYMFESGFIRSVSLPKTEKVPLISIFKSGKVVVILNLEEKSLIKVFAINGHLINELELNGFVDEIDKYYDFDQREILILANEPQNFVFVDLVSLQIVTMLQAPSPFLKFCAVKRRKTIVVSSKSVAHTLPFTLNQ